MIPSSFKYLGTNGNHEETARKSAMAKTLHRVGQVRKRLLNGKNKVRAINMHILSVTRHLVGTIRWQKQEIDATGMKTRKLLTVHGGFHPRAKHPETVH